MTKLQLIEALRRMVESAKEVLDKVDQGDWETIAEVSLVFGFGAGIIEAVLALIVKLIRFLLDKLEQLLHDVKLAQIMDDLGNYLTDEMVTDVAGIKNGFLPQLAGRNEQHWQGSGAKAYTTCTDLQGQACAELTTAYQSVAKGLHDAYGGCLVYAGAVLVAGGALIKAIAAAIVALIPPATPSSPVILGAGAAVFGAMCTAAAALAAAWFLKLLPELQKAEEELDKAVLNNGQTVFYNGKWPTPDFSPEK